MIDVYRKIFSLFDAQERTRFWILTGVMTVVALVEVFGMSAVLLLLHVLSDPTAITNNSVLSSIYTGLNFESVFAFQVALALAASAIVFVGLAFKAAGTYAITHFAAMRSYSISSRLLGAYLHQPYSWFLNRNSSEIGKNVLREVDGLVDRVIAPGLKLIANTVLVLTIVVFLSIVDPMVTFLSAALVGGSYALIYLRLRDHLRGTGEELMNAFTDRFRITQEAMGGVKDVKLLGLEDSYIDLYKAAARRCGRAVARIGVVSELPRFVLEAITFGTLLGLVLLLLFRNHGDIAGIVPTLGIFAFSVMRLLPALQQIYHAMANMRGGRAILDTLVVDYDTAIAAPRPATDAQPAIQIDKSLELAGLSFSYAQGERPVLASLDLVIPARTTVGFVGGTGAGKTTLVDVILGLLTPDSGEIRADGTPITNRNLRAWQRTLGYVPQSIYLTDASVAENIAFGVPRDRIDRAALERAARAAALHDFVVSDLPKGYDTVVGERGIRLSGGQRQRIGIARALYREPSLLIMDEATSALDNITERAVMDAVQNIRADKTIILIAHRLTTVKDCDCIFLMENGRIIATGTYDELVATNENFRKMASGR